ncbi:MAG: hypothetical protein C4583_10235 [Anaerolineaceae bacterium]|nr:MAG: hypothetical protein C4583_10235 [Anaerolineaceae bacterium]
MRVRRTFLNGIRPQGEFYLFNEICLRVRCDALAHGINPAFGEESLVQLADDGLILRSMAEENAEFAIGHCVCYPFLNGIPA